MVKAAFRDFVTGGAAGLEGRGSDVIGMITFARYADTISPPTLDHEALIGAARPGAIVELPTEDGTAIGDAIVARSTCCARPRGASKVMILLTDGSHNAGDVEPLEAAQIAGALGIKIYAIGAGTRGTALVPSRNRAAASSTCRPSVH